MTKLNIPRIKKLAYFKDLDLTYSYDDLTKLFNREIMLGYVEYLLKNEKQFTMAICNCDNFKNINNTYGYMTGDKVLQAYADTIVTAVGDDGVVGRYSGDEFIVVLEGTVEYNDIWKVFHQINVSLSETRIENLEELQISITSGISRFPIDGRTMPDLISTAQRALFRGKTKGKACFIIYLAAKHANIVIDTKNDNVYSVPETISKVYDILNMPNKSLLENIEGLLKYFMAVFKVDHISIESEKKQVVDIINPSCTQKKFKIIDQTLIRNNMNNYGVFFVNNRRTLLQIGCVDLHKALFDQNIKSSLAIDIQYNGRRYGIIRFDMLYNAIIWSDNEIVIFLSAARLIGTLLAKEKLNLD